MAVMVYITFQLIVTKKDHKKILMYHGMKKQMQQLWKVRTMVVKRVTGGCDIKKTLIKKNKTGRGLPECGLYVFTDRLSAFFFLNADLFLDEIWSA